MGAFTDLGGGTHLVSVSPRANRTIEEVRDVLLDEIVARLKAGPFRAGNIIRAEVFADVAKDDRLILLFEVDIATSPSLREGLAAVEMVAKTRIIASVVSVTPP